METNPKDAEVYVISCDRYETLALTMAGLCGFNAGYPIHVIDDASTDARVHVLLSDLRYAGKIASVEVMPPRDTRMCPSSSRCTRSDPCEWIDESSSHDLTTRPFMSIRRTGFPKRTV